MILVLENVCRIIVILLIGIYCGIGMTYYWNVLADDVILVLLWRDIEIIETDQYWHSNIILLSQ